MHTMAMTTKAITLAALACTLTVLCVSVARADENKDTPKESDNGWTISVTPYIWVPSFNGTLSFNGPAGNSNTLNVSVNPGSYLNKINSGFSFTGEVRKKTFAVETDLIYLNASTSTATVNSVTGPRGFVTVPISIDTQQHANAIIWTLAPSLTVMHTPVSSLDVLTGFRYAGINAGLGWQFSGPAGNVAATGSVAQSQAIWDWIAGVRGKVGFGKSGLFFPYYFDAGTGTSAFTWQAVLGAGYALNKYTSLQFVYRHLAYNEPAGGLVQQIRLSGPAVGATFHF